MSDPIKLSDPSLPKWIDSREHTAKLNTELGRQVEKSRAAQSLMFGFVTKKVNPLGGRCIHQCKYGYCTVYIENYKMKKYDGAPIIYQSELNKLKELTSDDLCFLCDMNDLFAENVPDALIMQVLKAAGESKGKMLLLSKNTPRMVQFIDDIPKNCIVGMTAETNRPTTRWSKAPLPFERFSAFSEFLTEPFERMISFEPLADFDFSVLAGWTLKVKPKFVAIGYNNYNDRYQLPEPYLAKVTEFIDFLKCNDIEVHKKTLREKLQ